MRLPSHATASGEAARKTRFGGETHRACAGRSFSLQVFVCAEADSLRESALRSGIIEFGEGV